VVGKERCAGAHRRWGTSAAWVQGMWASPPPCRGR
jgi:hypothetical protein